MPITWKDAREIYKAAKVSDDAGLKTRLRRDVRLNDKLRPLVDEIADKGYAGDQRLGELGKIELEKAKVMALKLAIEYATKEAKTSNSELKAASHHSAAGTLKTIAEAFALYVADAIGKDGFSMRNMTLGESIAWFFGAYMIYNIAFSAIKSFNRAREYSKRAYEPFALDLERLINGTIRLMMKDFQNKGNDGEARDEHDSNQYERAGYEWGTGNSNFGGNRNRQSYHQQNYYQYNYQQSHQQRYYWQEGPGMRTGQADEKECGILGVPTTATNDEIKSKYRKLAKEYHPDINKAPGSKEKFQEISVAYKVLVETRKIK